MSAYFGIALIITAVAGLVLAIFVGVSTIIWAQRCDPKNPSFKPPSINARIGITHVHGEPDEPRS